MAVFERFALSLGLTLLLELPIAWAMGLRSGRKLLLAVLVNVLTNPAAVLLYWFGIPQLPIELAVVAVEGAVYRWVREEHPWRVSLVCNGFSWLAGMLILKIGGFL